MKPGIFWLHVHLFDDPRRRVWAIQSRGRYQTARRVVLRAPVETRFRGLENDRQPRAYLRGRGVVSWPQPGVALIREA